MSSLTRKGKHIRPRRKRGGARKRAAAGKGGNPPTKTKQKSSKRGARLPDTTSSLLRAHGLFLGNICKAKGTALAGSKHHGFSRRSISNTNRTPRRINTSIEVLVEELARCERKVKFTLVSFPQTHTDTNTQTHTRTQTYTDTHRHTQTYTDTHTQSFTCSEKEGGG